LPAESWLIDALRIRCWLEARLLGSAPDAAPPEGVAPWVWELVLETEGCAAQLAGALRTGERDALPFDVVERLQMEEVRGWLGAGQQLRHLDTRLAEEGLRGLLFKGGRHLAMPSFPVVFMADVDVLAEEGRFERLQGVLGRGFFKVDAHAQLLKDRGGRKPPFDPWEISEPLDGFRALRALPLPEHIWVILLHGTRRHPFRRGVLRELLVLRALAGALGEGEEARLRGMLEAEGLALSRWLWELACRGKGGAEADELLLGTAAVRYRATRSLQGGQVGMHAALRAADRAADILLPSALKPPRDSFRHRWYPGQKLQHPVARRLEALAGPAGAGVRLFVRMARDAAHLPYARVTAIRHVREARRARAALPGGSPNSCVAKSVSAE
jgi:hypothetical protein